MADISKLAEGTVKDISAKLSDLSDAQLSQLHDLEHGKDNPRTTLLDAIHREQDHRKGEAPEEPQRDAAEQAAYDQGRRSRKSGIGRAESPFSKGALRDAYCEGWDFQDSL